MILIIIYCNYNFIAFKLPSYKQLNGSNLQDWAYDYGSN